MRMEEVLSFLGAERPGEVTWSHGTNSRTHLADACRDPGVMMIEGDISRHPVSGEIVMAHPPREESDLSFEQWVGDSLQAGKGIKLDFKDPAVVLPCLARLRRVDPGGNPVFLNADILQGPGGKPSQFLPDRFLGQCREGFPAGILSVGWTTGRVAGGRYSDQMVSRMALACGDWPTDITFPVRAAYVRDSWEALKGLLLESGRSLSVWSGEPAGETLRAWLGAEVGLDRAFFDLRDETGKPVRVGVP